MKILESYKKMMNEFIAEDVGYKQQTSDKGKYEDGETWELPPGSAKPYGAKHNGKVDYFDDEEDAKDYAQHGTTKGRNVPGDPEGQYAKEPEKGRDVKGLTRGDDDAESEPQSEPKDDKPKDIANSIADIDDWEKREDAVYNAGRLAQEYDPEYPEDSDSYRKELEDMGLGHLGDAIMKADNEKERAQIIAKASGDDDYDPDDFDEGVKVINGKKYREVKEDRADGKKLVGYRFAGKVYKNKDDAPVSDPTPVYESKKPKKHILKENYERFFGDR